MMERLNDIMGRTVQRRPSHYGYSDQQRVTQNTQGQPERPLPQSEAVTRNLQQEPRTYPAHNTPRQSRPLPEQLGRGGYSSRPNTTNSGNSAGQTGRIESSERLGRIPASQPSVPPVSPASRPAQNPQGRPSNTSGNYYNRERQSMPAVSRQQQTNPSGSSETYTHRPNPQRYNNNTSAMGNAGNTNSRAYQSQRSLTPSQQDEAYHPLKTRPIAVQFPTEDYTVSPRTRADAIDTWESDDRATGMQYGDWEEDEQEIVVYQRPTPAYHEADTYVIQQQEQAYSAYPQNLQHPHVTRNLHEVRIQEVAAAYPVQQMHPASNPAIEPAGEQYHRRTQPLDPRLVQHYEDGESSRQRSTTSEYSDAVNYDNYRTPQDAPTVLPAQRRPIRSLSQVKPQPKEMASISTPATTTNMLAPVSQSTKQVCPKCHGAGYLRADVPFGHPNFGKPIACECKEAERKEKRRQQLRDMSNMDAFRDSTFRTFNARIPGVQEAYQVTHEFAQDPDGWLLLIGPNGCGKTHLAAAIANQSLDSGSVVLFAVVPDLLDHLRAAFAPTAKEMYDQLFSKMREAELLVLDDLGSQQSSPWANEKLFQLLNYRYNLGMPTVITANPKGLQGVDERIRSRLCDVSLVSTVIMDRARDYRPTHPRRDV